MVEDLLGRVPLIPCEYNLNYSTLVQQPAEGRFWVQMAVVLAQSRGGAAMFTRSTPGCGTLDGPSLVWATSLWPKLKSSDGSPGLRLLSAAGQLSGLASDHCMNMHGIYMVYTMDIPCISCLTINHAFWVLSSSCPEMPCSVHVFTVHPTLIAALKAVKTNWKITTPGICMAYTMHILGICHVYSRYFWNADLTDNSSSQSFLPSTLDYPQSLLWITALTCP